MTKTSIPGMSPVRKAKKALKPGDVWIVLVIVLVTIISFGLGKLSEIDRSKHQVQIYEDSTIGETGGQVVASKKGSKYHAPWCPGAQTMKEENKIWFESEEAAEEAGYGRAGNCWKR